MTKNNREKIWGLASQWKTEDAMVNKIVNTTMRMFPRSFCNNLKSIEQAKEMSRAKKMTIPVSPNDLWTNAMTTSESH